MPEIRDHAHDLERLIALWDQHSDRPWTVADSRHGVNVGMINAYVSHSVNLARGVLAMHRQGLSFESISLVRSTMESATTAAWLAVYPEKTPHLVVSSAINRKKILEALEDDGADLTGEGMAQVEETLRDNQGPVDPEGKWLQARFESLAGGAHVYKMYRVLCTWDHATSALADAYLQLVEQTEKNPWGLVLLNRAPADMQQLGWIGFEVALVLRAQIAADMILDKPRHRTQLNNWARKLGLSATIEPAAPTDD